MTAKRQALHSLQQQTRAADVRLRDELYALGQPVAGTGVWAPGVGYNVIPLTAGAYVAVETSGRHVLLCDASAGAITVTLPAIAGNTAEYQVKKTDASANTVTVDGNAAETIDGGATAVLLAQYAAIDLVVGTATNWAVV